MLVHRVAPLQTALLEKLKEAGRSVPYSRKYYQTEEDSEAHYGYKRITRTIHNQDTIREGPKFNESNLIVVVAPERRRSKACILWCPGLGRYFSHTHAFDDFNLGKHNKDPEIDLLGLDLPRYGRAYVEEGYDTAGNEFNSVSRPKSGSHKWCEFYYEAYDSALDILVNELGYDQVYVMCNSTSGLTFQCFVEDVLVKYKSTIYSKVNGVIFTAPFWHPSKRGEFPISVLPVFVFNVLAYCFPKMIMDTDNEGFMSWFDELYEKIYKDKEQRGKASMHRDNKMPKQDPRYNPVQGTPYYIEWLAMVAEAQDFLRSRACVRDKFNRKRDLKGEPGCDDGRAPLPAICLMNDRQDKNVCVRRVGDLFTRLYPNMELKLIHELNHEVMLSCDAPYAEAVKSIRDFILSTRI